jgi:hypothetical protein
MNFNNGSSDGPVGTKTVDHNSDDADSMEKSKLDRTAMESAQKAQKHQHENANTNSSNTIFSK